jgi:aconitase A
MNEDERPLSTASRIYFGIHHPIQYNVKVKELGYVHPGHLVNLKKYWALENQDDTEQDTQVTAEAATESPAPYTGGSQQQQQNDEEPYQDDNNDDQTGHNPYFGG